MNPKAVTLIEKYKGDGRAMGIEAAKAIVNEYLYNPNIHENQYSALVSFADNVGASAFITSNVLRMVNEGRMLEAADELLLWRVWGDKDSASMKRRRIEERKIFLTPAIVGGKKKRA